jgi:hypothetical protein
MFKEDRNNKKTANMIRVNKRLKVLTLGLLLTPAIISQAQNYYNNNPQQLQASGSRITAQEKYQLQQQFSGSNFQVRDDGAIVFTPGAGGLQANRTNVQPNYLDNQPQYAQTPVYQQPTQAYQMSSAYQLSPLQSNVQQYQLPSATYNSAAPVAAGDNQDDGAFLKKEKTDLFPSASQVSSQPSLNVNQMTGTVSTPVNETGFYSSQDVTLVQTTNVADVQKTTVVSDVPVEQASTNKKAYNNLKEAKLDTSANLDRLKKANKENAAPAETKTKRQKTGNDFIDDEFEAYMNNYNRSTSSSASDNSYSAGDSFSKEPTYYVNGKEVDRNEFNQIQKTKGFRKVLRDATGKVSGNPAGEIFAETN